MLDECKGDKFEEVLRVFSIAVLRKEACRKFGRASPAPPGYSEALSIPENLTAKQRERLIPLVLAHTQSLQRQLTERRTIDQKFRDERQRLDNLHQSLAGKQKAIFEREDQLPDIRPEEVKAISDHVRAAWTGDELWAETLLHGGTGDSKHLVTADPLCRRTYPLSSTPEHQSSIPDATYLLEELNERIQTQQSRLQKWTKFRARLEKSRKGQNVETVVSNRKPILKFRAHQELEPFQVKNGQTAATERHQQVDTDQCEIIKAMRAELANLRRSPSFRRSLPAGPDTHRHVLEEVQQKHESASTTTSASELPPLGNTTDPELFLDNAAMCPSSSEAVEGRNVRPDHLQDVAEPSSPMQPNSLESMSPDLDAPKSSPTRRTSSYQHGTTPKLEAFDIESSTSWNILSPGGDCQHEESPPSPSGSSISSSPPHPPIHSQVLSQHPSEHIPKEATPVTLPTTDFPSSPPKPHAPTLLERTRQSMALLPALSEPDHPNRQHPITTKNNRRQPQPFPTTQFQTPCKQQHRTSTHQNLHRTLAPPPSYSDNKVHDQHHPAQDNSSEPFQAPASSRASTPRDQLFSEQADYESVFKSRPRVAVSPPGGSPGRRRISFFGGTEKEGKKVVDGDEEGDVGDQGGFGSSPVRKGRR
jgi:HAUS augmin-like complex subunit 6 N-terminus